MATNKSKEVEVVEAVETPVVVEAQVEQEVEQTEIPVPADFKGKELLVDGFASEVSVLAGYVGGMEQALLMVVNKNVGNALLVSQTKEGGKELVLLVPENLVYIQAALASRPSLRPLFKETVRSLIETGRKSAEYQKGLSDLAKIEADRQNVIQNLRDLTEQYAAPFDAESFIAMWSLDDVVDAAPAAASATGRGRGTRSTSKHNWSAAQYTITYKGEQFTLSQGSYSFPDENGIERSWPWAISNGYGQIVSAGTSAADADKAWLASMGMSTSVNSAKRWNAAAVEAALK